MSIIEKLGIKPGPWRWVECGTGWFYNLIDSNDSHIVSIEIGDGDPEDKEPLLMATAPELLEALIDVCVDGSCDMCTDWKECKLSLACTLKVYGHIIEKATGKTWEEIKELI